MSGSWLPYGFWDEGRRKLIKRWLREKTSRREIATRLGVTELQVTNAIANHGLNAASALRLRRGME